jgi:phosphotransferase system  glucose/maltose/N-acetylglucosamine-specific IIC component
VKLGKTSKRTLVLAITAAATFVWCGIRYFDIPPATMLGFFVSSVAVLAVCICIAFILVFVLRLIKGRRD